ncbi:MAG: HAD hydrolase family protein [Oligoflexia bacterium]|nr:HAD hydrolase family protein [Oligoflexia bacterium]
MNQKIKSIPSPLKNIAKKFKKKLLPIKFLALDADGILTNGLVYYSGNEIEFNRYFNVYDGYIIKVLINAGIEVGVISGGNSIGLCKRIDYLKINPRYVFLGSEDKRDAYLQIKKLTNLSDNQICYMGDDLYDIPLLNRVGFAATVPDASIEVKAFADYVTKRRGGEGAVREVADLIRYAQGIYPLIEDF